MNVCTGYGEGRDAVDTSSAQHKPCSTPPVLGSTSATNTWLRNILAGFEVSLVVAVVSSVDLVLLAPSIASILHTFGR